MSTLALRAAATNDIKAFEEVGNAQRQINRLQLEFSDVIRERIASVAIIA